MKKILLAPEIKKAIQERRDIIQKAQEQIGLICQTVLHVKNVRGAYSLSSDCTTLIKAANTDIRQLGEKHGELVNKR